jgi:phage shock protein A
VIVPIEFVDYLPKMLVDLKFNVNASMAITKPSRSKLSQAPKKEKQSEATLPAVLQFGMDWDEEAQNLIKKAPEGIIEMAITNAEDYARQKGYAKVTRTSLAEQMEEMGMNLDQMLG